MKVITDDEADAIRHLLPEKRMALILMLLFRLGIVDDDDYLYMVEAATAVKEPPPS